MKTFEEAFKAVTESPLLMQNMEGGTGRATASKAFADAILGVSEMLCKQVTEADGPVMIQATLCSGLQTAFELGLLTGMEMEKP